jgi:hypothetical protein
MLPFFISATQNFIKSFIAVNVAEASIMGNYLTQFCGLFYVCGDCCKKTQEVILW